MKHLAIYQHEIDNGELTPVVSYSEPDVTLSEKTNFLSWLSLSAQNLLKINSLKQEIIFSCLKYVLQSWPQKESKGKQVGMPETWTQARKFAWRISFVTRALVLAWTGR